MSKATMGSAGKFSPRDQILRDLDVGTHYAGARDFYFSLLISSEKASPVGVQRVREYADIETPRRLLREHRPDGLQNLKAVGQLEWSGVGEVFAEASGSAACEDERRYASRALAWLQERGLAA